MPWALTNFSKSQELILKFCHLYGILKQHFYDPAEKFVLCIVVLGEIWVILKVLFQDSKIVDREKNFKKYLLAFHWGNIQDS